MRPKIFLSHSKKDKKFIEKIANDLRNGGIDVWYDEWEIPVGESIRKKIFEEGITSCDLFFVYLTKNSIPSYWVQKELDGAIIHEIENQNSFMALFVDNDSSRSELSVDLRALNIPVIGDSNYLTPFSKLISKAWDCYSKNLIKQKNKDSRIKILELEKEKAELRNTILQLQKNELIDYDLVKEKLEKINFTYNSIETNLLEILLKFKVLFADGTNPYFLKNQIAKNIFQINVDEWKPNLREDFNKNFKTYDVTGELILLGILETKTSQDLDSIYIMTEQGIKFINNITTANIG